MKNTLLYTACAFDRLLPIFSVMIMCFCGAHFAFAQAPQDSLISISGQVIDENNQPIIGASVFEVGSTRGTHTNLDGRFALHTLPHATLRISYIGYDSQEVKAVNGMSVRLKENSTALDEIVVVGYGQQKKVNLTGAVSSVDVARNLEGRPQQDVSKALQGTAPG